MKTNVVVALDTRVPKNDGTCALILRIVHNRLSTQIPLNIYLNVKDWDMNKRIIKPSYRGSDSVSRLNNYIIKRKAEVVDFITKLEEKKLLQTFSHPKQIKELLERNDGNSSFLVYMQGMIDSMLSIGKIGNARSYSYVKSYLSNAVDGKDLSFLELNYNFLQFLEQEHLKKGNSVNGLAVCMRTIKAAYNHAIKAGVVEREMYPFTNYTIKTKKTRKRAISINSIQSVEELKLDEDHMLYHTRNYFLFCFYMRGMPFADMAHLKLSNIIDGRIIYDRQKTFKPYNIKLAKNALDILAKYISGKKRDDYIFDIVKRETIEEQYNDIEWARNRYNKRLKKLATLCGIQENITSYVGRHSFGTIAKNLKIPIANISDMLGHSSIKTTEVYLDSLPNDVMDDYHEQILSSTHKNPKNKSSKK